MAPNSSGTRPKSELDLADQLGAELVRFVRLINRAKSQVSKQGPDGMLARAIKRARYMALLPYVSAAS